MSLGVLIPFRVRGRNLARGQLARASADLRRARDAQQDLELALALSTLIALAERTSHPEHPGSPTDPTCGLCIAVATVRERFLAV